jgi:hypothetical protein
LHSGGVVWTQRARIIAALTLTLFKASGSMANRTYASDFLDLNLAFFKLPYLPEFTLLRIHNAHTKCVR